MHNETRSFSYLLDTVATVKDARLGRNDFNSNFGSAMSRSLCLSIFLPRFATFRPKLKE